MKPKAQKNKTSSQQMNTTDCFIYYLSKTNDVWMSIRSLAGEEDEFTLR